MQAVLAFGAALVSLRLGGALIGHWRERRAPELAAWGGSLLRARLRWVSALGLVYAGLAVGVAVAVPVKGSFSGSGVPPAQDHLDFVPARVLAILGNSLGTVAAVLVALLTIRHRPLGNTFILAGLAVAGAGSALVGLGEAGTAAVFAAAVLLLYLGFSAPADWRLSRSSSNSDR